MTLAQVRAEINGLLETFYAQQLQVAATLDANYGQLWQAMLELHQAGGKRLRPYIMMTAYSGLGGLGQAGALQVAASLELLHTSMLMHDDIIDRDYIRHGRPNVAGMYRKHYGHLAHQADHYANSAALLGGDLALSSAYQLILTADLPDADKISAGRLLGTAAFTVAGGELLDFEAVLGPLEVADSLKIALLKTASYSFIGPLHMGATLAGAGPATLSSLRAYGEALGIAYQLADDMLGLFGDEAVTGKSATSDLEEGKPTYLIQRAAALVSRAERQILVDTLARGKVSDNDARVVREIVESSGAVEEVEQQMRTYSQRARDILIEVQLSVSAKAAFDALALDTVSRRQ